MTICRDDTVVNRAIKISSNMVDSFCYCKDRYNMIAIGENFGLFKHWNFILQFQLTEDNKLMPSFFCLHTKIFVCFTMLKRGKE